MTATERPEFEATRHADGPTAPDGSGDTHDAREALRGAESTSDVRSSPPARDAWPMGYDEASRVPDLLADKAALMGDVDRLTGERDRAIGFATRVEAENARLTEWQTITTRALDTACGVLQEASGLPDDIDDPDCRDEMVLALRPRAEKAEAENARLRECVERMASEMQRGRLIPGTPVFGCAACGIPTESEPCRDHDEGLQHAGDMLRALLADTDSAQDEGAE